MSSFANVVTEIVDPVFDRANNRVEFRLPEGEVYLSSMRLLNVGITSGNATQYNPVGGAYLAIKSIQLYDGAQLLDQLRDAPLLNALKQLNRMNDENLSMNRYLRYNGLGYTAEGQFDASGNAIERGPPRVAVQNASDLENGVSATSQEAWISLKDALGFLSASAIVPTGTFRHLRLVVEYNSAAENKYHLVKTDAANVSSTNDALLVVERVMPGEMQDRLMKAYKGVSYKTLETDKVRLPATAAPTEPNPTTEAAAQSAQEASFLMNGFNNKYLKRVMVVAQPTVSSTYESANTLIGYGKLQSVAMFQPKVQLRVNGANRLPGSGLEGSSTGAPSNRRLAMLTDAWSDFNIVQGYQYPGMANASNYISSSTAEGQSNIVQRVGQQDIFGCEIEQKVNELVLEVGRTGVANDANSQQPLDLTVVGEVVKAVSMDGRGGYVVQYL